ncbi:adenylate/guanylate cyclase [Glaciecola sp. 4H-3-7+YE-5]|nr:adenylate/guanylate cyclase [Glaciecola sp. 4H-3-7+YE-5]
MVTRILHAWIWCGIPTNPTYDINPTRISNIISLMVIFVLLLQVPISAYYWRYDGLYKLGLIVSHCALLCFVPLLNRAQLQPLAKMALVFIFISYICWSSVIWQANVHVHYYLLLGIFVCPFIFSNQRVTMWLSILSHVLFFLLIDGFFILRVNPQELSEYHQTVSVSSSVFLALSCTLTSFHIGRNMTRTQQKLSLANQRSESLLLNILPLPIAQRLKYAKGKIADQYEQASICFVDLESFSLLVKSLKAHELVDLLDDVFTQFDQLSTYHGLEKIKTIGDGYMAAAGVPKSNNAHALQCCAYALAVKEAFVRLQIKYDLRTGLRIGIGSGEVVAGVIGRSKFCYDLWGEAVTLAARMESHGRSNHIQVTQSTYEMAKHKYCFEPRGEVSVKGLGQIQTYWLLGVKE